MKNALGRIPQIHFHFDCGLLLPVGTCSAQSQKNDCNRSREMRCKTQLPHELSSKNCRVSVTHSQLASACALVFARISQSSLCPTFPHSFPATFARTLSPPSAAKAPSSPPQTVAVTWMLPV